MPQKNVPSMSIRSLEEFHPVNILAALIFPRAASHTDVRGAVSHTFSFVTLFFFLVYV